MSGVTQSALSSFGAPKILADFSMALLNMLTCFRKLNTGGKQISSQRLVDVRLNDQRFQPVLQIQCSACLPAVAAQQTGICDLRQLRGYLNGALQNAPGYLVPSPGRIGFKARGMFPNGAHLLGSPGIVLMHAHPAPGATIDASYYVFLIPFYSTSP